MRLPEFTRTTTFRWTILVSGAFGLCTMLMFGFVYWKTTSDLVQQTDHFVERAVRTIEDVSPENRIPAINERLRQNVRRHWIAGLFDSDGKPLAGNLELLPPSLEPGAPPRPTRVMVTDNEGREGKQIRAVSRLTSDGQTIVVGQSVDELSEISNTLGKALILGLLPALCLGVAIGGAVSIRSQQRIDDVNRNVQRIIAGELRQRLPRDGTNDPLDKLAAIVNGMLDEIEKLIQSVAGVGNDIAHDLRTPLTRVRIGLERALKNAKTVEELKQTVEHAIGGLDQSLSMVTALLRIADIEQSRRISGFGTVALRDLVREVADLYEPIAEDKGVTLKVTADYDLRVLADRDLLFEAIANLVDNAVKFTPEGGEVGLSLARRGAVGVVRVSDSGPGITENERELVTRRFYRSDKSRGKPGFGLGLSLVAAIIKLHNFELTFGGGPGCVAEIQFPPAA